MFSFYSFISFLAANCLLDCIFGDEITNEAICAIDYKYVEKSTFTSMCLFDYVNCLNPGKSFIWLHNGKCDHGMYL